MGGCHRGFAGGGGVRVSSVMVANVRTWRRKREIGERERENERE